MVNKLRGGICQTSDKVQNNAWIVYNPNVVITNFP